MLGKCLLVLLLVVLASNDGSCQEFQQLLANPPAGIFVERHQRIAKEDVNAISKKLGGQVRNLTNSNLKVHGRQIQMNVITAVNPQEAERIESSLLKIKKFPFCIRRDNVVIEFVGSGVDESLARKTAFEFGIFTKPKKLLYRIQAELATIDKADYMACNPLFQQFLLSQTSKSERAPQQLIDLAQKFEFGNRLILRNPSIGGAKRRYQFQPTASESNVRSSVIEYSFDELMHRFDVPFVTVNLEMTVDDTGFNSDAVQSATELLNNTWAWPSRDPEIKLLEVKITKGTGSTRERVVAILEWLTPGKNIQYSGVTGSRYGTLKVLQQKFGHCWDFSDCFVTLARAAGIPCRQVAGWLYGSSGHVWAEYYDDQAKGWQQVDPTGGNILPVGLYHIPYFTTEDGHMPIVYLSMPKIDVVE